MNFKDEYEKRIITISMPVDILSKLDMYAKKMHISRSAAVVTLLVQGLEQSSAIEIMSKLMEKYEVLEKTKKVQNVSDTNDGI